MKGKKFDAEPYYKDGKQIGYTITADDGRTRGVVDNSGRGIVVGPDGTTVVNVTIEKKRSLRKRNK